MAKKQHFKSSPLFSDTRKNVDRKRGIVRDVVIVKEGIDKDFGYFSNQFLKDLTNAGNQQRQGVKSRFGHPNMCKSSIGSFIGRYKNFRHKNAKVIADLHLDPITKKTQVEGQGISMYEYIMDMSANNPDMFGNSIHFMGPVTYEEKEVNGEKVECEVYHLHSFLASDLVDTPAATESLFKNSNDLGIIVTEFLDENPDIFEVIRKDETIIGDFLKRYDTYVKNYKSKINQKMSILKRVQKMFSTKKDIDVTLDTGDVATVLTDEDVVTVGDSIVDADGNSLEDGTYPLNDGVTSFVVVGGKIDSIITDEEETDEISEDEIEEVSESSTKALKESLNKVIKSVNESVKTIELISQKVAENEKQLTVLRKNTKTSAPTYKVGDKKSRRQTKSVSSYDPEKAAELRKKGGKQ